jgi:hypothetical protein
MHVLSYFVNARSRARALSSTECLCSLLMDRVLWCSLLIDCVLSSTVVLVGESKTWLPELVAKARALVVGAGCDASSEVYPLPPLPPCTSFVPLSPSPPCRNLMYHSGRTVVVWERKKRKTHSIIQNTNYLYRTYSIHKEHSLSIENTFYQQRTRSCVRSFWVSLRSNGA